MKSVHKTAVLGYSAEKMFALVEDVEKYPEFLPWCSDSKLEPGREQDTVTATLFINFHGLRHSFSTINHNEAPQSISMKLAKGPFNTLDGKWTFTPLTETRSRIDLEMRYEFSNGLFEKMLAPIFDMVSITLVDSFRKRAKTVYG